MPQKIKLKPEFEKKLGDDKDKFLKNLINYDVYDVEYINGTMQNQRFEGFISGAFIYGDTPEGDEYWEEVSKR